MSIVVTVVGILLLVIVALVVVRLLVVKSQGRRFAQLRVDRVRPLQNKLDSGQTVSEEDVLPFATNVLTREATFHLLSEYQREDLFPSEYHSLVKGAESNLANWLEFPTELGACPDEIEHIKRATFDGAHYEVFKYRVNEPHWAAKNDWMIGVVGPFSDESKPYDFPGGTFSRVFSTLTRPIPTKRQSGCI